MVNAAPATAANAPPERKADKVIREKTTESQAALYRLNGDYNPLHADPVVARKAGFETYVVEDACRGIDTQGSLAKAWDDMAKAGVKRIQSADIA